jgi:hypothetical protein
MKSATLFILLLTSLPAFCQTNAQDEDIHAKLVQGKKKSLIVYAGKDHSFTMDVVAKTVKPSDVPGFITIDRQIIQSTLVPASQSAALNNPTTFQEKDVLTKYMNYELGYYRKKLRQKYTNLQSEWMTIQGRLFLVWYFDMPKDYKLVSRQIYFSTIFYGQVMDLNAPLFKRDNFSKAREILTRLATSLKTYDRQLDLAVLNKQVNKP